MNVAMVQSTPIPPEEGIGYYVYNLSSRLVDRGHGVTVITRGGLSRGRDRYRDIPVFREPSPPIYPFHVDLHGVFVNRLLDRLSDRFDLVHVHTPLTPAVRMSLPVVSTVHSSVIEGTQRTGYGDLSSILTRLTVAVSSRRLIGKQIARADRVTTTAESVSEQIADHYGVDDTTVIGNGVAVEKFRPGGSGREDGVLLYAGRLDPLKGLTDLVDAMVALVADHDVVLKIAGKGPLEDKLKRRAERRGISDHVRLLGHLDQERLIRLYQRSTAFVFPSRYEGLPTAVLEAMACGAPVVATAVGGCPDVIDDGVNGTLVPPRDPEALTRAIAALLDDETRRDRYGTNARETMIERYSWETIADAFEREYARASENG